MTSYKSSHRSARISIIFSIIRLDPSEIRRRRLLYVAGLFFVVCVILIAQLFWICEREPGWKDTKSPQCTLNKQVVICQLVCQYISRYDYFRFGLTSFPGHVADVVADSILIAAPLKLLAGLQDKGLRRRLIVIFSTCIVTTIVSLVHAAYILRLGGPKVVVAAIVEVRIRPHSGS